MSGLAGSSSSPWVEAIGWMLVHSLWQGAGVAMAMALVLCVLRRAPAQARYLAACAAMLLIVALPVATLLRSGDPQPRPRPITRSIAEPAIVGSVSSTALHPAPVSGRGAPGRRPVRADLAGDRGAVDGRGRRLLDATAGRLDPGPAMGAARHTPAGRSLD